MSQFSRHPGTQSILLTLTSLISSLVVTTSQAQTPPALHTSSQAQIQLRKSSTEAWNKGDARTSSELLQGYLLLGPTNLGWLELARAQLSMKQCKKADTSLKSSNETPTSDEVDPPALQALRDKVEGEFALQCDDQAAAKILYALGQDYFEQRRWREAAQAFEKAFNQDPVPTLGYNAGRSHEYAGDLSKAKTFYGKALALNPPLELRTKLENTLERLNNILDKLEPTAQTGLLEINTTPSGAILRVNGKEIGTTPFRGAYPSGEWTLVVEKAGYESVTRTVTLEAGREFVLETALASTGHPTSWFLIGSSAVLLGSGIIFGKLAEGKLEEASSLESARNSIIFQNNKDTGQTFISSSIASYVLSGLLFTGGVVLFFIDPPQKETKDEQKPILEGQWQIQAGPEGWSAGWGGTW